MSWTTDLAAASPGLLGAGLAAYGQHRANQSNLQESARNRDFQERMYRNRYQIQRSDMEKAGINPILAAGASPPGPPGGSTSSSSNEFHSAESVARHSLELRQLMAQLEQTRAQTDFIRQQSRRTSYEADTLSPKAKVYDYANNVLSNVESYGNNNWSRFKSHFGY